MLTRPCFLAHVGFVVLVGREPGYSQSRGDWTEESSLTLEDLSFSPQSADSFFER